MSEESPFRNPAAGAPGAAAGYVAALVELVGGRDPLAVMDQLVPEVRRLAADLDAGALAVPEAPGKWSVVEVVQHLADSEIVIGYRLRVTVAEDRPALPGYDQDAWAARLRYRIHQHGSCQTQAIDPQGRPGVRRLSADVPPVRTRSPPPLH